jgi:DNA repair protein RecO (recombination protein O)
MIFCDYGIVLRRRPLRENDRIVTVFTRSRGKFEVNFKGVRFARAKLRALSEPVSRGDYRFYLKNGSTFPVCTGGETLSVFPRIRLKTDRLFTALYFCEVINAITPVHQPSPEKYELLSGALENLENEGPGVFGAAALSGHGISPWMRRAFTLRMLETAGFGFKHSSVGLDSRLWDTLHDGAWSQVHALRLEPQSMDCLDNLLKRFFSEQLNQQLKTLEFI